MSVIPATPEAETGGPQVQHQPGLHSETLSQKLNKNERAGGVAQVVELLPSMYY
jgi:hypothetical protein